MTVAVAILAAGSGSRFGSDKTRALIGGRPIWRWSFDTFTSHPLVDKVLLVGGPSNIDELNEAGSAVLGGSSRQQSSRIAIENLEGFDLVLIHDAARPLIDPATISRVIEAASRSGAAAACVRVVDTLRIASEAEAALLDRDKVVAMQTPQGAKRDLLLSAHLRAAKEYTDEMALLQAAGTAVELVQGDDRNFKVTNPEDIDRARALTGPPEIRTGLGYDIHAFSDDPSRPCMLGGVEFDGPGLEGHSDADVLLHAIADSILGAASLGDIGQHFPNTDALWKDSPSSGFVARAAELAREAGWKILHVDATVIAETPKIMGRAIEIRSKVAATLEIELDRVSVKATTNEGLGSLGRKEGVAAFCVATLCRS